jgi:hypothetical protein
MRLPTSSAGSTKDDHDDEAEDSAGNAPCGRKYSGELVSNVCPFPFDGKRHPAPFVVSVQVAPRSRIPPRTWASSGRGMSWAHVLRLVVLPEVESKTGVARWPGPPFRGDEQRGNRRRTRADSRHSGEIAGRSAGPGQGCRHPWRSRRSGRSSRPERSPVSCAHAPRCRPSPGVKKMTSDVKTAPLTLADASAAKEQTDTVIACTDSACADT